MHKIPLNENWTFRKLEGISIDAADAVHIDELCSAGLTEKVSLPHTWYMDEEPYRGLTLYEKAVTADTSWEKLFIREANLHDSIYNCKITCIIELYSFFINSNKYKIVLLRIIISAYTDRRYI